MIPEYTEPSRVGSLADARRAEERASTIVLVIDYSPAFVRALSALLRSIRGICVLGLGLESGDDAVKRLEMAAHTRVDAVVLGPSIARESNPELLQFVSSKWPESRLVAVTKLLDRRFAIDSPMPDATAPLTEARANTRVAVELPCPGGPALSLSILDDIREASTARGEDSRRVLTGREVEVVRLVAEGRTNREIATTLEISPRTVHRHLGNILRKLGCKNRVQVTGQLLDGTFDAHSVPAGERS